MGGFLRHFFLLLGRAVRWALCITKILFRMGEKGQHLGQIGVMEVLPRGKERGRRETCFFL